MLENKVITFIVPTEYNNKDLKTFLKDYCKISSRVLTKIKRIDNGITRNNIKIKTIDIVHKDDEIIIKLPQDNNEITPIKGNLDIKYEDEYILVINKPPLMPVHPTKIHQEDTLANLVSYYMNCKNESYTFRCINRLDKDTSGLVVIAKDRYSSNIINKTIDKTYYAICEGTIDSDGTINKPIMVMPGRSIQRITSDNGERAITHYHILDNSNNHTYLEIKLETGKTHQIRCHFSSIGHPLAGDDMYGGSLKYISRQALHCGKICFNHPITKNKIEVTSNIPLDMEEVIKK